MLRTDAPWRPWEPASLAEVAQIFNRVDARWWIAGGLLGFAIDPDLGPLSRSLLAELSHGPRTLAELKDHALVETAYRPPHAGTIAQKMLRQGTLQRIPPGGHLTGAAVIKLAERVAMFLHPWCGSGAQLTASVHRRVEARA